MKKKSLLVLVIVPILAAICFVNFRATDTANTESARATKEALWSALQPSQENATPRPKRQSRPPVLDNPAPSPSEATFWRDLLTTASYDGKCKERWQTILGSTVAPTDFATVLLPSKNCVEPDPAMKKLWSFTKKICVDNFATIKSEFRQDINEAACADVLASYRRNLAMFLTEKMPLASISDPSVLTDIARGQMSSPKQARAALARLQEVDPQNVDAKRISAMMDIEDVMRAKGPDTAAALDALRERIADPKSGLAPETQQQLGLLATVLTASKKDKKLLNTQIDQLLNSHPVDDSLNLALIPLQLLEQGQPDKALDSLTLAMLAYPNIPQYPKLFAAIKGYRNQPEQAEALYISVVREMIL